MRKGFTLIELVAVFAVMLILITIGTISLSKTLSTNNKKTVQLKSGNILRTLEDYILENKINLPETRPLYFSVSSLIKQDILNTDANQVIAKTLNKIETNKLLNPFFATLFMALTIGQTAKIYWKIKKQKKQRLLSWKMQKNNH